MELRQKKWFKTNWEAQVPLNDFSFGYLRESSRKSQLISGILRWLFSTWYLG